MMSSRWSRRQVVWAVFFFNLTTFYFKVVWVIIRKNDVKNKQLGLKQPGSYLKKKTKKTHYCQ